MTIWPGRKAGEKLGATRHGSCGLKSLHVTSERHQHLLLVPYAVRQSEKHLPDLQISVGHVWLQAKGKGNAAETRRWNIRNEAPSNLA